MGRILDRNLSYRDDIPVGWRPLFDQLVADINTLDPALEIVQAKQKFGELRVYLDSHSAGATGLIDAATRQSRKTCEVCGLEATLCVTRGYYETLCKIHGEGSEVAETSPIVARFRLTPDGVQEVDVSSPTDNEDG